MTILVAREERCKVRKALRFMRTRLGGSAELAAALRVKPELVGKCCGASRAPSAGLAIRLARVAGVTVEAVLLSAEFPPLGVCPHCGRSGP